MGRNFLALTDYVPVEDLVYLSAEALQLIVCGEDGFYLEQISNISKSESVKFVSTPCPGFEILASNPSALCIAESRVVDLLFAIKSAAAMAATQSKVRVDHSTAIPRKISKMPYHPLFSSPPLSALTKSAGLLPLPHFYGDEDQDGPPPVPMSDEEIRKLIKSPYLSFARRKTFVLKEVSEFDKELEGYLPGVPGVRSTKEYKKIRRKITEIDDLLKSGIELDHCQKLKVKRRNEYLDIIKHMLRNGVVEELQQGDSFPNEDEISQEEVSPISEELLQCKPMCRSTTPIVDQQDNSDLIPISPSQSQELSKAESTTAGSCASDQQDQLSVTRSARQGKKGRKPLLKKVPLPGIEPATVEKRVAVEQTTLWSTFFEILVTILNGWFDCIAEFFIGQDKPFFNITPVNTHLGINTILDRN